MLPDHCADWIALEHDVDYHNANITNNNKIHQIEELDNKAINRAWTECLSTQPITTSALVAGLKAKNHFEVLAEQAVFPFGSNEAVYPGATITNRSNPIPWFSKLNSRRRPSVGKHAV